MTKPETRVAVDKLIRDSRMPRLISLQEVVVDAERVYAARLAIDSFSEEPLQLGLYVDVGESAGAAPDVVIDRGVKAAGEWFKSLPTAAGGNGDGLTRFGREWAIDLDKVWLVVFGHDPDGRSQAEVSFVLDNGQIGRLTVVGVPETVGMREHFAGQSGGRG